VRSRGRALRITLLVVGLTAAVSLWAADPPPSGPVRPDEIVRVLAQLEADPQIAPTQKIRILQWDSEPKEPQDKKGWAWLRSLAKALAWIGELFGWLAQSGRVLVWVAAAVLVAFLLVYLARVIQGGGGLRGRAGQFSAPSFVRDLDIRPESLPPDIGAAALVLWEQGEHRAALALLYRGLLSRLAHVHAVPIRDSSTEGDCLAIATRHLRAERLAYVSSLIRTWQSAVYGGEAIESAVVRSLCADFSAALDAPDIPQAEFAGHPA
jgi:hypothetical protein